MPKLFVFAIGGTGERVMRSLTMVLASGAPAFGDYEVFPIIIDYDTKNADKDRTVGLLQNYSAIHNAAFSRHGSATDRSGKANQFFASKLTNLHGLENYVFPFHPAGEHEQFRQHIGFDSLSGDTLGTSRLLDSLYDDSNRADTELNLDMTVGFKGNPNIGSVVFHTINSTPEFAAFRGRFQPEAGDKAVVIGSLFGGTGASGIPEIVKAIDESFPGAKNNGAIAALLVLPYFAPAEQKGGAIQASRFNSKTKAALSFYKDSGLLSKISKVYYVGDPKPTVVPYSEGGKEQLNNANFVELIAAMMIEHFISGKGGGNLEFKYSPDINLDVQRDKKAAQRIYKEQLDEDSVNNVLDHLIELAIALKFFHDEIAKSVKIAKDSTFFELLNLSEAVGKQDDTTPGNHLRSLCTALNEFYDKYQAWLKELDFEGNGDEVPANSHRLALADMTKDYSDIILKDVKDDEEKPQTVMDKLGKLFQSRNATLTADFLVSTMNDKIKDKFNDAGHYDTKTNSLRANHEPEWVFADILHLSAIEGLKELKK